MSITDLCQEFSDGLSALFTCEINKDYLRIRTPYLYPDGDIIDLFCQFQGEGLVISDLGETTRWLRMQTIAMRRSPKHSALIEDVCLNHGIEFYKGMLMARCHKKEELSGTVIRLAQAALRVADLWFTFRSRSIESATEEVADFLTERKASFARGERLIGRSGRVWTPDFHIRSHTCSSLVYVLSTGSRSAARNVVYHVHTAFYDLNILALGPEALQFVALFDDSLDVWSDEDYRLTEQLAEVTRWSKPEEFLEILKIA